MGGVESLVRGFRAGSRFRESLTLACRTWLLGLAPLCIAGPIRSQESADVDLLRYGLEEIREATSAKDVEGARWHLEELAGVLAEWKDVASAEEIMLLLELESIGHSMHLTEPLLAVRERLYRSLRETLPDNDPRLFAVCGRLAANRFDLGDEEGGLELQEWIFEQTRKHLPEGHRSRIVAQSNLATMKGRAGELEEARDLLTENLEVLLRLHSEDHPDVNLVRSSLAGAHFYLGEVVEAVRLQEDLVEALEPLPERNLLRLLARADLATYRRRLGDLEGALEMDEARIVSLLEGILPAEHPKRLSASFGLASTKFLADDLEGARVLQEELLATYESLGRYDLDRLVLTANLALTKRALGDLEGALALEQSVLAAYERLLPEEEARRLLVESSLVGTRNRLGDHAGAIELGERVLQTYRKAGTADTFESLSVRANLADAKRRAGDLEGALVLSRGLMEYCETHLPPVHSIRLYVVHNLATLEMSAGRYEQALELLLQVRAGLAHLPVGSPLGLEVLSNLALTRRALGDESEVRDLVAEMVGELLARYRQALAYSPREARAMAWSDSHWITRIVQWSADADQLEQLFDLLETRRHVTTAPLSGGGVELAALRRRASRLRAEVNSRVQSRPNSGGAKDWEAEIQAAALARDRCLADLRTKLREIGLTPESVSAQELARALPEGAYAVGYLRYHLPDQSESELADGLLALILSANGDVTRVDIGAASEIEDLASQWLQRVSVSQGGRGGGPVESPGEDRGASALSCRLRERILDPIIEAVSPGDGVELYVALDDVLHTIPLDALLLGADEGPVGSRWKIRPVVSFATLLEQNRAPVGEGMLLVGDVDFEQAAGGPVTSRPSLLALPPRQVQRGGSSGGWESLPASEEEVRDIALLYESEGQGQSANLLTGKDATKKAIEEKVRGQRYFHVATHGWFAPERVRSSGEGPGPSSSVGPWAQDAVRGFAPMTLCGLVLSGANQGRLPDGSAPGLLTAEELAGFDLSRCELAVLSACETNVGLRRAGLGIQSLQAAIHAAGARSSLTSLWHVNDDWTLELMTAFYERFWKDDMELSDALWRAKMDLRERGRPLAAWAGWVLTGAPDS